MVYAAGCGWLEEIAADGTMDEESDFFWRQARGLKSALATGNAWFAGANGLWPKASFADARHQFQAADGQFQSVVEGL